MEVIFSARALRDLEDLPTTLQRRIILKLRFFVSTPDPFRFARHLEDPSVGEWRFRIGDYRVICDADRSRLIVLKIGHRKEIYR